MIYKLFPEKDSTLYSSDPSMNSGLDPILEALTEGYDIIQPYPQVSRFLIQFNNTELSSLFTSSLQNVDWKAYLKLYNANSSDLSFDSQIYIHLCAKSWSMGTGCYNNYPETTNGVSWNFLDYSGSSEWIPSGETFNNSYGNYTGSYNLTSSDAGGGVWWVLTTGSSDYGWALSSSITFNYRSDKDINKDVTDLVYQFLGSGSVEAQIPNYGFLIKQPNFDEFLENLDKQSKFKFFSIDTHTIYPPHLEFRWDDSTWNTGSSVYTILNDNYPYISIKNNPGSFNIEAVNKFRIFSRPEYPARVFQTSSIYTKNYYLPPSSSYAVMDLDTNEYVINFDSQYTKISADSESNYFSMHMNGLEPERYYKILISCSIGGSEYIIDSKSHFKVKNG